MRCRKHGQEGHAADCSGGKRGDCVSCRDTGETTGFREGDNGAEYDRCPSRSPVLQFGKGFVAKSHTPFVDACNQSSSGGVRWGGSLWRFAARASVSFADSIILASPGYRAAQRSAAQKLSRAVTEVLPQGISVKLTLGKSQLLLRDSWHQFFPRFVRVR